MINNLEEHAKQTWCFFILALPAVFGGLVHYLVTHDKYSLKTLVVELLTALFTGYVVASLLAGLALPQGVLGAITSLAGYTSIRTLKVLSDIYLQKVGDIIDKTSK